MQTRAMDVPIDVAATCSDDEILSDPARVCRNWPFSDRYPVKRAMNRFFNEEHDSPYLFVSASACVKAIMKHASNAFEAAAYANAIYERVAVPLQGLENQQHYLCIAKALRFTLRQQAVKITDSNMLKKFHQIIVKAAALEDSDDEGGPGDINSPCKHVESGYATA